MEVTILGQASSRHLAHYRHTGLPKSSGKPPFSSDYQSVGAGQVRSVIEYGGQVLAG